MTFVSLDNSPILNTEQEIFNGLRIEWVPPLNFQVQMEHGKPFCESVRKRINFGPLVKETPFEREKRLKEMLKEPPTSTLVTKEVTAVEAEAPPIKKVAFSDETLISQSLTGFSMSLGKVDQNKFATSIKELSSEKSPKSKSYPKGILKGRTRSKYSRQGSNQSGSQQSKNTGISTQHSYTPQDNRKLSIFARFNELHTRYVQSESDHYSEDSIKSLHYTLTEENLDPLVELYRGSSWGHQKGTPTNRKSKF